MGEITPFKGYRQKIRQIQHGKTKLEHHQRLFDPQNTHIEHTIQQENTFS